MRPVFRRASRPGLIAALILGLLAVPALQPESVARKEAVEGGLLVTGDIHGLRSWTRLLAPTDARPGDRLLVLGDFGLVWSGGPEERAALETLDALPWEILFIDGNHENFDLLARYPIEDRYGGRVRRIRGNIYQLLRGEVYEIAGRQIFTFGGGWSRDQSIRKPGVDWWAAEGPTAAEEANALRNLGAAGWRVDYLFTHAPSRDIQLRIAADFGLPPEPDEGARFIASLKDRLAYGESWCGHFHVDLEVTPKDHILRDRVVRLF